VLDDQFFSLAEMNAFLDVQGQSGGGKAKDWGIWPIWYGRRGYIHKFNKL
jgi:hypothetical protein